jgi:hypothetical protein
MRAGVAFGDAQPDYLDFAITVNSVAGLLGR